MKLTINPLAIDIIKPQPVTIDIGAMIEGAMRVVQQAVDTLIQWGQSMANYDYQMERWVASLPTRGWIQDGHAYLIVRDDTVPGRYVIIKDDVTVDKARTVC